MAAIKPSFGRAYQSYIIVPADSPVRTLAELRNKSFAFVDLQSYTGRLVTLYDLTKTGHDRKRFFSRIEFSKSHDASVEPVAGRKIDGAAVMSLVFEYMAAKNPSLSKKVRIIHKSEKAGYPLFVASKHLDRNQKDRLTKILFSMNSDPTGRVLLKKMQIDGFIVPNDKDYNVIRKHIQLIKEYIS